MDDDFTTTTSSTSTSSAPGARTSWEVRAARSTSTPGRSSSWTTAPGTRRRRGGRRPRRSRAESAPGRSRTEEMVEALRHGIAKHGRRWRPSHDASSRAGSARLFGSAAQVAEHGQVGLVGGGGAAAATSEPRRTRTNLIQRTNPAIFRGRDEPTGRPAGAQKPLAGRARCRRRRRRTDRQRRGGGGGAFGGAMSTCGHGRCGAQRGDRSCGVSARRRRRWRTALAALGAMARWLRVVKIDWCARFEAPRR